ncbi:MAG: hypothetical protein MR902_02395 [Campylobacter sp.]|nr:hypothetical protein [Campylobacter sp.]
MTLLSLCSFNGAAKPPLKSKILKLQAIRLATQVLIATSKVFDFQCLAVTDQKSAPLVVAHLPCLAKSCFAI